MKITPNDFLNQLEPQHLRLAEKVADWLFPEEFEVGYTKDYNVAGVALLLVGTKALQNFIQDRYVKGQDPDSPIELREVHKALKTLKRDRLERRI